MRLKEAKVPPDLVPTLALTPGKKQEEAKLGFSACGIGYPLPLRLGSAESNTWLLCYGESLVGSHSTPTPGHFPADCMLKKTETLMAQQGSS